MSIIKDNPLEHTSFLLYFGELVFLVLVLVYVGATITSHEKAAKI